MAVSELWRLIERDRGSQPAVITVHSVSLTPTQVSADDFAVEEFTVSGVTAGERVIGVVPAGDTCAVGAAFVSAADTIKVTFVNPTAGALTPDAGTFEFVTIT